MNDETKPLADIDARIAMLKAELHSLRQERQRMWEHTPERMAIKAKRMREYLFEYRKRPGVKEKQRKYHSRPDVMARDRERHRRKYAEHKGDAVRHYVRRMTSADAP
jgi:hypothetical protein